MPIDGFPVQTPAVLKASTPGSHPVIRAVWLLGFVLLIGAVALFAFRSFAYPALAILAAAWFLLGLLAYVIRHVRFLGTLARGEAALRAGDLRAARAIAAPLVDRYPLFPPVQRLAGLVLYPSGHPLSPAPRLAGAPRSMRAPH